MHDTTTKRTLVLGATGFLGSAVVEALLAAKSKVTALLRTPSQNNEFVTRRLFEKVSISHGIVEDTLRLRQIIALHEIDAIVQCAAGTSSSATHSLTESVLLAAAASERKPTVIVPLPMLARVKFQSQPPARLDVAFVRLPDLFGPGMRNMESGPGATFARHVSGQRILASHGSVCDVQTAAEWMVQVIDDHAHAEPMGRWLTVPASATHRELHAALQADSALRLAGDRTTFQEKVRDTLDWFRAHAEHARMAAPRQRAAA